MPYDNVPAIGDALFPLFVGITVTDGIEYTSASSSRIDGKYLLKPIQDELLAHQYALQHIDAGNVTAGTLPVARGGTGVGSFTAKSILVADSAGTALTSVTGTLAITGFDSSSVPVAVTLTAGQSVRCNAGGNALEGYTPGTVTSISTGSGLTGGPITGSGTISVATNGITDALFRQSAATSVVGVAGTSTANVADIVATGSRQVLQVNSTTGQLAFQNLDIRGTIVGVLDVSNGGTNNNAFSAKAIITSGLAGTTFGEVTGTLAIVGFNGSSKPTAVTLAAGESVRCNAGGTGLEAFTPGGTGTVTNVATGSGLTGGPITNTGTISVATNGITNALFRQSSGLSLIGVTGSSTANVADITATGSRQVMQCNSAGNAIGFQNLDIGGTVTGVLNVGNGGTGASTFAANGLLYGNTTSAIQVLSAPSTNCPQLVYYPTNSSAPSTLAKGTALQYLRMNSGATGIEWATITSGMSIDVQYFAASGTWTKPADAKLVRVICIGGGGGGGGGRRGAAGVIRQGGAGGRAGFVSEVWYDAAQLGSSETITIGVGGTGASSTSSDSTNGSSGGDGENTYFGGTTETNSKQTGYKATGGAGGSSAFSGGGQAQFVIATSTLITQFPQLIGATGGSSATNCNAGSAAYGPGSGAGGGGISAANVSHAGGLGGNTDVSYWRQTGGTGTNGGAGGSSANGSPGTAATPSSSRILFGSGGGGGGGGGNYKGGAGGQPGGGGGGGGASLNGTAAGGGGNGGAGGCIVITYY